MIDYQLYFLSDDDRDVDCQDHRCADDSAAVLTGRSLCFENNIDIWQGTRRVARVSRGDFRLALQDALRVIRTYPPSGNGSHVG